MDELRLLRSPLADFAWVRSKKLSLARLTWTQPSRPAAFVLYQCQFDTRRIAPCLAQLERRLGLEVRLSSLSLRTKSLVFSGVLVIPLVLLVVLSQYTMAHWSDELVGLGILLLCPACAFACIAVAGWRARKWRAGGAILRLRR